MQLGIFLLYVGIILWHAGLLWLHADALWLHAGRFSFGIVSAFMGIGRCADGKYISAKDNRPRAKFN